MLQYSLLFILSIPFLWLNYKIILGEYKTSKISNTWLGYLLLLIPFYYTYLFFFGYSVSFLGLFIQIIVTISVSFILYFFGIWSAGNAKYLLVLGLFVPHIGIIPFIGNIALICIVYLLLYFFYFYLIKNVCNHTYRKSLIKGVYSDIKEGAINFLQGGEGEKIKKKKALKKIIKFLFIFLMIFVAFRLTRIYVVDYIVKSGNKDFVLEMIYNYNIYLITALILLYFLLRYLLRIFYKTLQSLLVQLFNIIFKQIEVRSSHINNGLITLSFIGLLGFILTKYLKYPQETLHNLYLIFTLYLFILLIVKIIIYAYKITFHIAEQTYVHIQELSAGSIVDKQYLLSTFRTVNNKNEESIKNHEHNKKFFREILNPLSKEATTQLQEIFKKTNKICKKDEMTQKNFNEFEYVKILKTFLFSRYIFSGFIITFLLGNTLFLSIIHFLITVVKSFYGI